MKAVCQALQRNLSRPIVKNRAAFFVYILGKPAEARFLHRKSKYRRTSSNPFSKKWWLRAWFSAAFFGRPGEAAHPKNAGVNEPTQRVVPEIGAKLPQRCQSTSVRLTAPNGNEMLSGGS